MPPNANQEFAHTFDIHVKMTQEDSSSESATMVDVSAWVTCQGSQIAKCQGSLVKREMMRDPEMFPYLMEVTQELEDMAKEYGIFHPDLGGKMTANIMVEYFEKLGFFHENDYSLYRENMKVKQHPCNRAWILYFNALTVDEGYRRRHIGRGLVRRVLEIAMRDASDAGRPLLACAKPGYLQTRGEGEAVSVHFWRAMGFEKYSSDAQPELFFWGAPKGLP